MPLSWFIKHTMLLHKILNENLTLKTNGLPKQNSLITLIWRLFYWLLIGYKNQSISKLLALCVSQENFNI